MKQFENLALINIDTKRKVIKMYSNFQADYKKQIKLQDYIRDNYDVILQDCTTDIDRAGIDNIMMYTDSAGNKNILLVDFKGSCKIAKLNGQICGTQNVEILAGRFSSTKQAYGKYHNNWIDDKAKCDRYIINDARQDMLIATRYDVWYDIISPIRAAYIYLDDGCDIQDGIIQDTLSSQQIQGLIAVQKNEWLKTKEAKLEMWVSICTSIPGQVKINKNDKNGYEGMYITISDNTLYNHIRVAYDRDALKFIKLQKKVP